MPVCLHRDSCPILRFWRAFLDAGSRPVARSRRRNFCFPVLATLGSIVREGCDSPESLAVRLHLTPSVSCVAARKHYDAIRQHIQPGSPNESFDDIVAGFDNLDDFDGDA